VITLTTMTIAEFLNGKYLEWQYQTGQRKTIEEFGELFGASQQLMTAWMNGKRSPGPEYKKRIIEKYGDEAIRAFGEDPDLYRVIENWAYVNDEARKAIREQTDRYVTKNDTERSSSKTRTRKADT